MTTLAIVKEAADRANVAKEAAKLLADKYPNLVAAEPALVEFIKLRTK